MAKKKAPAKKKAAKPSTALARVPHVEIHDPSGLMAMPSPVGQLGELATVGALGLSEITLTDAEEAVLAKPIDESEILIKPDGTPYLPWAAYSRWFSAAFGRVGWSLVPAGKPNKTDNLIVVPYMLYIHGKPVAFAWGEQDYFADNKRQSFGDAIESTQGSGLRRCAKRLGVALDLWDKAYLARWKAAHCLTVKVERRGEMKTEWRRKVDPPLPGESRSRQPPQAEVERTMESSQLDTITPVQGERMWSIARKAGRSDADVALWLKKVYKVKATEQILQKDYTAIVKQLEARGPLPMPGDGQ